jgi:4-hydroxy-3-methylbut-2-en-1-yl diphosphate synthase IspG/GcpE
MNTNLHEEIYEQAMTALRVKYYREDNATAIPRDDFHYTYYKMIVDHCAQTVEHIRIWNGNLGDHIRSKMGTL